MNKECPHILCSRLCDWTDAQLTRIIAEIVKLLKDTSDSGVRDASRDMISVLSRISCKGNNTGAASSLVGVNGNEPSRGSCCS